MELTSAFTSLNGVCSGAHGRPASRSLVSLGGRTEDDGRGCAEQYASLLNCLNVISMKLNDFFCRMGMSVAIWLSENWRLSVATKKRKRHCVKSYNKNADSSNNERERDCISNDTK